MKLVLMHIEIIMDIKTRQQDFGYLSFRFSKCYSGATYQMEQVPMHTEVIVVVKTYSQTFKELTSSNKEKQA